MLTSSIKLLAQTEIVEKNEGIAKTEKLNKEVSNKLFKNSDEDGTNFDYNSEDDTTPVVNFDNELHYIKELKAVDIVFLVDCTASMQTFMRGVKKYIRKLVWDAKKCLTQYLIDEPEPIKLGIVKYRDHPPENKSFVTEVFQLSSDDKAFKSEIMKLVATGGGDGPEAVLDGLQAAVSDIHWRDESMKFIYHFCDAPPHGTMYNDEKDGFPDGCPCNIEIESIVGEMRSLSIEYNLIQLNSNLDKFITILSRDLTFDVIKPEIEMDKLKKYDQTD